MHRHLKERLVGAAVIVVIAVIFIPMFLTGPIEPGSIKNTNIPARPIEKFNSKLIPLTDSVTPTNASNLEEPKNTKQVLAEGEVDKGVNTSKTKSIEELDVKTTPSNTITKPVKDKQVGLTAWVVQLGSFTSKVNADKLNLTLRKSGFPAFVEPLEQDNEIVYRVRVGPELLRADADELLKKIKENSKLDGIVLNYP